MPDSSDMDAVELMTRRPDRLRLVIFDCDGVLIDSEGLCNRLVAEELTTLGWPMTPAASQGHFLGMTLTDMVPVIEARLGRKLSPGWQRALAARLVDLLGREVKAIDGAEAALRGTTALGLPWRIASNSSHAEMAAKFGATGLTALVAGRLHSHHDVRQGKPAPDLFLAAAAAEGVPSASCIVVEDSVPGTLGARAAGMDVLGFCPHGDGAALIAAGAVLVRSLAELACLFRLGLARREKAPA